MVKKRCVFFCNVEAQTYNGVWLVCLCQPVQAFLRLYNAYMYRCRYYTLPEIIISRFMYAIVYNCFFCVYTIFYATRLELRVNRVTTHLRPSIKCTESTRHKQFFIIFSCFTCVSIGPFFRL